MTASSLLRVAIVLTCAACHGRNTGGPPLGADASADAFFAVDAGPVDGGPEPDAGTRPDAALPDGGPPGRCSREGFPRAFSRTRADAQMLQYSAINNLAGDPTDLLQVQRFYSLGATRSDEPQFVTLRDESYADCSTCVLVLDGCTLGATVYDASDCDKTFLARAGTIEFTFEGTAGGELLAFLHDVELVEVEIDPESFATTRVPGGETWCLPSFTLEDESIAAFE